MLTLVAKLAVALQEPLAYLSLCGYKRGSEIDSKYEARIQNPQSGAAWENGQLSPAVQAPALKNRQGTWLKAAIPLLSICSNAQ